MLVEEFRRTAEGEKLRAKRVCKRADSARSGNSELDRATFAPVVDKLPAS